MDARDQIPYELRISFYHEALILFLMKYSDPSIIEELLQAIQTNNVLNQLEEMHTLNDIIEIDQSKANSRWFIYHQVVGTIAEEYGVADDLVNSTVKSILSAIGGDTEPRMSKLWALFLHDQKDLAHLKLINSELFLWRRDILKMWDIKKY